MLCLLLGIPGFLFFDHYIAPWFLDSYIERVNENGLPKAIIENGDIYFRMKADDFRLPVPMGCRLTNVVFKGGFDWVDGSVEIRFDGTNMRARNYAVDLPKNLPVGANVTSAFTKDGAVVFYFHYFGDK